MSLLISRILVLQPAAPTASRAVLGGMMAALGAVIRVGAAPFLGLVVSMGPLSQRGDSGGGCGWALSLHLYLLLICCLIPAAGTWSPVLWVSCAPCSRAVPAAGRGAEPSRVCSALWGGGCCRLLLIPKAAVSVGLPQRCPSGRRCARDVGCWGYGDLSAGGHGESSLPGAPRGSRQRSASPCLSPSVCVQSGSDSSLLFSHLLPTPSFMYLSQPSHFLVAFLSLPTPPSLPSPFAALRLVPALCLCWLRAVLQLPHIWREKAAANPLSVCF